MKYFLAIIFSFLIFASADAATYYVGKNGSDSNSCTAAKNSATPKLTINVALNCIGTAPGIGAGHIVEVAAGTYAERIESLPSGTSWSNPFTLHARTGDTVTLLSPGNRGIDLIGSEFEIDYYTIVSGFVIDGSNNPGPSGSGIDINGPRFLRFQNNDIKNSVVSGPLGSGLSSSHIYVGQNSSNIEFLNNEVHDGPSPGHGLYIEASNTLIEGNHIYNIGGFPVHIYSGLSGIFPSNNIVRGNIVHDCVQQRETGAGILLATGNNNQAYNNIVYQCTGTKNDGGTGISLYNSTNSVVFNNTVYGNTWMGIDASGSRDTVVKNNAVFSNAPNLDFSGSQGGAVPTGLINSNNYCNSSETGCTNRTNPGFVNAAGGDFNLIATSALIDAGTDNITAGVTLTFNGNAPDVGAYEFGGTLTPSPTPTPPPPPNSPPSTTFNIGDRIQVISTVNVRAQADITGTLLGSQSVGALGTVVAAPILGSDAVVRWNINYDSGADGWSGEAWLSASSESLPPTILVGDLNNDRIVNSIDFSILNSKWLTSDSISDLNHDGIVNSLDFSLLNQNWLKTI